MYRKASCTHTCLQISKMPLKRHCGNGGGGGRLWPAVTVGIFSLCAFPRIWAVISAVAVFNAGFMCHHHWVLFVCYWGLNSGLGMYLPSSLPESHIPRPECFNVVPFKKTDSTKLSSDLHMCTMCGREEEEEGGVSYNNFFKGKSRLDKWAPHVYMGCVRATGS